MNVENFHIGAGDLKINSVSIGHTTADGVVVTVAPNVHIHQSGKWGTTGVRASVIGYEVTLEVTMAESTLANLNDAVAGSTVSGARLQIGGLAGRAIDGVELQLIPYDNTETWTFRNAVPTSSVEVAFQVENERVYKVTFTALVDEDASVNENIVFVS